MQPTDAPRIGPLPEDQWDEDLAALVNQRWTEKPGQDPPSPQNLFRTLARHRELFRVWGEFGRVVLNSQLPARDRELLVLRSAWLTQGRFEWAHHEPLARSLGITAEEIQRIVAGPEEPGWDELDATLLRAVDELHETGRLSDATWAVLRPRYDDEQLIEIPVIVGQYHLVAYLTNSLGIAPSDRLPSLPTP